MAKWIPKDDRWKRHSMVYPVVNDGAWTKIGSIRKENSEKDYGVKYL